MEIIAEVRSFYRPDGHEGRPCKLTGAAHVIYRSLPLFYLHDPFAGAAFMAVRSVVRPNLCFSLICTAPKPAYPPLQRNHSRPRDNINIILIINVLHSSTVGAGFIPALPTSDENLGSYHAAARMGINPTPAAAECCKLSLFMSY